MAKNLKHKAFAQSDASADNGLPLLDEDESDDVTEEESLEET